MPLSADLTALLAEVNARLAGLAVREPLVALKALADLQYVIAQADADAALGVVGGRVPFAEVAVGLGTSETAGPQVRDRIPPPLTRTPGRAAERPTA
ncbi:hypothetical protein [Streptomyces xanthophaeus]|uniref:hypothetical protein n=1 Tax=Streptomyces xanthophaeus TaxID=67385 RepID=UPI0004CDBE98|nr:hypothetical protein [Streptomyces xanthophaeus]